MKLVKSGISGINASSISLFSKHNIERKTRQAQDIIRHSKKTRHVKLHIKKNQRSTRNNKTFQKNKKCEAVEVS